ncbi:cytochrome P450 [Sphingobium sp. DEHP117]|uniref:cytochrome P450 n=1 Tax=Sphingobium sp. DEHP117 TaxID=2993436 RepID=UPI0027D4AB56|nr:cytochrome P450 [Sphingobium sp. DEHP117]MDQ4420327.1 cytochrome P450 [Sphingobium sp. DEHP117]
MMNTGHLASRPAHVPAELVFDFDLYNLPGAAEDVQAAFAAFQQRAPDIFWTPHNGGHWVATRANDIVQMQLDHRHFSHNQIAVPAFPPGTPLVIPINLDPPEHTGYRRLLNQYMVPSAITKLEARVRQVAIDAIERLVPQGECEFIQDFSQVLPIDVFLSLVDLPIDAKKGLLPIAEQVTRGETQEIRVSGQAKMFEHLNDWVQSRRDNPGSDLLSQIVTWEIDGKRIGEAEAISYAAAIFFGGLDTVAGMSGFIALFLARNPGHRRQLAARLDDAAFMKNAVEELFRRHGLANTARLITEDLEFGGVQFKAGDLVLPANVFVGLDERINPDPLTVDFNREKPVHAIFGNGPHACPGATLARREIRIFLEEWLARIPDFSVKPGTTPVMSSGVVSGIQRLELVFS